MLELPCQTTVLVSLWHPVDRVTTLLVGGSEPVRIACSASSPEVTTFPEWELGFRLLYGREDSDAAICAFRASLTTRSTNRLPNDRKTSNNLCAIIA